MEAKHGYLAALFLGATALLVVFFVVSIVSLQTITSDTNPPQEQTVKEEGKKTQTPPKIKTVIEGANAQIVEIDENGDTKRIIYESVLTDNVADFSSYAVPQDRYNDVIYVQAILDASSNILKLYPLNVETKTIGQSIINTEADVTLLSPNEEYIALTTLHDLTYAGRPTGLGRIEIFDLTTGQSIFSQNLTGTEWLVSNPEIPSSFENGWWDEDSKCYNTVIWLGEYARQTLLINSETRRFCRE